MVTKTNLRQELITHIKAKYSVIAIQTAEEQRAIKIIRDIANNPNKNLNPRKVYICSTTKGVYEADNEKPSEMGVTEPFMLDMQKPIEEDPNFRRKLRDLHTLLKSKASTIILIAPQIEVHQELQKIITVFDLPLPDKQELMDILCGRIAKLHDQVRKKRDELVSKPDLKEKIEEELEGLIPLSDRLTTQANDGKDAIVSALQGLTENEADEVLSKCIVTGDLTITTILQEKKQIVTKSGALDYWESDETQDSIGGLKNLKMWSASARNRFSEEARKYGITPPKGALLVGAPGTGKTLSAKALANLFRVPLLILTMAKMTSKFYGETGNRMINAIKLAQAMSPCIVLVDEIDKAFGSGGNQEHEESARTRGALLTAMEESEGIFWLATCNQPANLAPELMARFPVIFHVDLPATEERREIFAIHLKKIGRDPVKFDMEKLISSSDGYVGREIRNALQEALGAAFDQKKIDPKTELNTEHVLAALKNIIPTATQRKEDIDRIRRWSDRNARPANEKGEEKTATTQQEENANRELEL
jgi:SpoVK/Ycf46/Vps4 family AAA+-type ATPase